MPNIGSYRANLEASVTADFDGLPKTKVPRSSTEYKHVYKLEAASKVDLRSDSGKQGAEY